MIHEPESLPATQILARFTERLESVGGTVSRAQSSADLAAIVLGIADDDGIDPRTVLWMSRALRDAAPSLAPVLASAGRRADVPPDPGSVRDQPLGIALARAAIAETGSVLLVEPEVADRAVSLVTQTLIVLCPLSGLVPSLDEAAAILRDLTGDEASYMTFVTGPSRTADIERELTVGVQGPGRLHVIVVNDRF